MSRTISYINEVRLRHGIPVAEECWTVVLRENPDNREIAVQRANFLAQYLQPDDAAEEWRAILDLHRVDENLLKQAQGGAGLLHNRGEKKAAVRIWEKMIDVAPHLEGKYRSVMKHLNPTENPQEKRQKATPKMPPRLKLGNARNLVRQEKPGDAVRLWIPLEEQDAGACAHFAKELEQDGYGADALVLWKEIQRVDPIACLAYLYEYLKMGKGDWNVLQLITLLLPRKGQRTPLSYVQRKALVILAAGAGSQPKLENLFQETMAIVKEGQLSADVYVKTFHHLHTVEHARFQDEEMERYLHEAAPKRGGAWKRLEQQRPIVQYANTQSRRALTNSPDPPITYIPKGKRRKK